MRDRRLLGEDVCGRVVVADIRPATGYSMSLTLYSRVMLWIGASLAVATAITTAVSIEQRHAAAMAGLDLRLAQLTGQQAIAISNSMSKLDRQGVEIILGAVARDPDFVAVDAFDERGALFASVRKEGVMPATELRREESVTVSEAGAQRTVGRLVLTFSEARLREAQWRSLWEAVNLGMLQLLAVLVATGLALRAVIRPIEATTKRMMAVAAGDLESPIPYTERRDELGDVARAVAVFSDEMDAKRRATEELEAVQAELETRIAERTRDLRESEERLRQLFDNSPLPKWVYSTETLRFLEVNDAAVARYGYSREEFLAMTLMDIRPPSEQRRLSAWLQNPPADRHLSAGWRHIRKDGSELEVDVFLRDMVFRGQPARLSAVIDVTERHKLERLTQRIFETSQDIILVTDGYGTIQQASPSARKVLGYAPEEIIGRSGAAFVMAEELEATRAEMRAARRHSTTRQFRCRYIHKDGRVVPLLWMATWSQPDHSYFFMGRDMSEYERTEEQLRHAQKMEAVGQLTGGVAHDFNNILMVIMTNAEAVEEEESLDPYVRDRVKGISKATSRAAALTRQLLAFSRRQPLRPQLLNVNDLTAGVGKLLQRTLGEQIEIDAMLADELWHVEIDPAQLESALVNLSINARDAMANGGRLLIETRNVTLDRAYVQVNPGAATGDYVMLSVADTGVGMTPGVAARAFDPFFTTKPVGKGTGLGLSMVYGFIKQSNGHIKICSTPGEGTTVKLYLPRSAAQGGEDPSTATPPPPRGQESVLVVEDGEEVRTAVARQLRSLGYAVVEAADGAAGLAALEAESDRYDLVLTDVIMPGSINGKALAEEAGRRWPRLRFVFMSGYPDNAIDREGRLDRGVLLLSKPFRKSDLAQILRQALERPAAELEVRAI